MAEEEPMTSIPKSPSQGLDGRVQLTAPEYDRLVRELETLRGRYRAELARRLRDARAFGSPGDNDDVLAVFEDAAVDDARIAQLEHLLRSASVVDEEAISDGRVRLGCRVVAADENGRIVEFNLIGRRITSSGPRDVSLASPVGKALLGARAADVREISLPDGRKRTLTILEIESPHADAAEAA
jgi:transcription elongation factor GreA